MTKPNAIVLLSGGLDSTTCLYWARQHYTPIALSFDYGQRHDSELAAATRIATNMGIQHRVATIDIGQLGGSSLTDTTLSVPDHTELDTQEAIPNTYVPARNTIFLSYGLALAEVSDAIAIVIGVNAVDYSGYPDCRPEYIAAFQTLAGLATKVGVSGQPLKINTPLIDLAKSDIIRLGLSLGVDYAQTVSCYKADLQGRACGVCDSCYLRRQGFSQAGIADPTVYR